MNDAIICDPRMLLESSGNHTFTTFYRGWRARDGVNFVLSECSFNRIISLKNLIF